MITHGNIHRSVLDAVSREPRKDSALVARSTQGTQISDPNAMVQQKFLAEMRILELGQEMQKVSLKHLKGPGDKEVLRKSEQSRRYICSGPGDTARAPESQTGTKLEPQNKVALDYDRV